jgi:hypothetical protein
MFNNVLQQLSFWQKTEERGILKHLRLSPGEGQCKCAEVGLKPLFVFRTSPQ